MGRALVWQPPNPAAGAGLTFVVPADCIIKSIRLGLSCDANVANRRPYISPVAQGATGGTILGASNVTLAAGGNSGFNFSVGALRQNIIEPIETLGEYALQRGDSLTIGIENIQAGDQVQAIVITAEALL